MISTHGSAHDQHASRQQTAERTGGKGVAAQGKQGRLLHNGCSNLLLQQLLLL